MEIISKQSLKVVGIQVVVDSDYLSTEIPHAWNMLFRRADEIINRVDNKYMEISVKKEEKLLTQLICVEVNELSNLPDGMVGAKFPAQEYLLFKYNGNLFGIPESFGKMYKWAEENGYQTGHFKIDYGYYEKEKDTVEHFLYLALNT